MRCPRSTARSTTGEALRFILGCRAGCSDGVPVRWAHCTPCANNGCNAQCVHHLPFLFGFYLHSVPAINPDLLLFLHRFPLAACLPPSTPRLCACAPSRTAATASRPAAPASAPAPSGERVAAAQCWFALACQSLLALARYAACCVQPKAFFFRFVDVHALKHFYSTVHAASLPVPQQVSVGMAAAAAAAEEQ